MSEDDEFAPSPTRSRGRPRKGDAPLIDYEQLDKLLVYGELTPTDDGSGVTNAYPTYAQLGERFSVSISVIRDYAKKHNTMARRERARLRTQLRVEEKMVETRAEAIVVTKERELQIIDAYLAGFEKAITDGRVRFDNPTDYNTMARLKEFLLGGADSRPEVNATLSLDVLQARHRDTRRATIEASPAERGEGAPPAPSGTPPSGGESDGEAATGTPTGQEPAATGTARSRGT
jgi:hypothetical protein